MHEVSICQSILALVQQQFPTGRAQRVTVIVLEIGQLAGVDKAALLFSFELVAAGSVAEGATLQIIEIPGEALCLGCNQTIRIANYYDCCNHCGQYVRTITQGEGLRLKSMEVE